MTILERLKRKTVIEGDCWLWTGNKRSGYGMIRVGIHMEMVHRISANLFFGFDLYDKVLQVNHKCSNRNCWNPDHIYIGTQKQNMNDVERHVGQSRKTHCPRGHEYSGENLRIKSNGHRECRACIKIRGREYYTSKSKLKVTSMT